LQTNAEVLAVDQGSTENRPLIVTNGLVIWSARPNEGKGLYLAVFNRADRTEKFAVKWNEVGLVSDKPYKLRDLWKHKELGTATSLQVTLQPHACVLYRADD
jgi:alpha-galactosidase